MRQELAIEAAMRRIICGVVYGLVVTACALAQSEQGPSLGDFARQQRAVKKQTKARTVYTNDNMPTTATISIVGEAPEQPAAEKDAKEAGSTDKNAKPADPAKQADMRQKLVEQTKETAILQRELELLKNEYKLQTSAYYLDAGSRLRDDKRWAEQRKKFEDDIAAKQKDLDAAKERMTETTEEARKAGMEVTVIDGAADKEAQPAEAPATGTAAKPAQ